MIFVLYSVESEDASMYAGRKSAVWNRVFYYLGWFSSFKFLPQRSIITNFLHNHMQIWWSFSAVLFISKTILSSQTAGLVEWFFFVKEGEGIIRNRDNIFMNTV